MNGDPAQRGMERGAGVGRQGDINFFSFSDTQKKTNVWNSKATASLHILNVHFDDLRNAYEFIILLGCSEMTWGERLAGERIVYR